MKLRYKIANGILALLGLTILSLGLVISHTADCEPAPALSGETEPMKAMVSRCYGSPDVLALEDIAKPAPADDEVLVKLVAASVNPLDWHYMRGSPFLMRLGTGLGAPTDASMGVDFAGTVVAVGIVASVLPVLKLLARQQYVPITVAMKIHFLQWFPRCRLQGDDLPVNSINAVLRVVRKLIHDVSIHVHYGLVSKLFPREPAVTQMYVTALEGDASRCVSAAL